MGMSKLGVELLNQSQLSDGKKFKCVGSHIVGPELGASCVVQISESGLPCPGLGSTHLYSERTSRKVWKRNPTMLQ